MAEASHEAAAAHHTPEIPAAAVIPFIVLLLGIAILPLVAPHWWEENRNKGIFAAVVGIPMALYLAFWLDPHMLEHAGEHYFSFIALLGSLYIVSGGIVLRGDLRSNPAANAGLLAVGSVLASIVGTTGASMLLIRPFLRANQVRGATTHLPIFFIFCVSNAGGLLTPLGDPPLFLGYLEGVPFTWTLALFPEWLMVNALIIAIFYVFDLRVSRQEGVPPEIERQPLSIAGAHNFIYLILVVVCAAKVPMYYREAGMGVAVLLSLVTTKKTLRAENGFTYHPIGEVAILFAAIFVTMEPALKLLNPLGDALGIDSPQEFYWITGLLSSFLDNAPTYLTFFDIARVMPPEHLAEGVEGIKLLKDGTTPNGEISVAILRAISLGAVFMGANTYIGNGPNFMVKAICDEAGFKTPSFFGYMAWSMLILLPIWALVALVSVG